MDWCRQATRHYLSPYWWPWMSITISLQWRHNEHKGVSNHRNWTVCTVVCSGAHQRKHQSYASLALVRRIQLWRGFSSQRASNAENVSIWWRHHTGQWSPNKMASSLQTFSKQLISNFEIQISKILHFVFGICPYPIYYQLPLVQIMAWRRTGDKSLSAKNEDLNRVRTWYVV